MLNGVGNQFVHDECERHCHVSGDNERVGIDDKRPRPIWAARCGCNCLTKINKVTVKRHCSNIVILVKLLVDEGDSRDARRCIVELASSGARCFGLQVQETRNAAMKNWLECCWRTRKQAIARWERGYLMNLNHYAI